MAMHCLNIQATFLLIITLLFSVAIQAQNAVYDITKFGAVSDDKTDSSAAFMRAWKKVCTSRGHSVMVIPSGRFMLQPVTLQGPCKGTVEIQNKGVLSAPKDPSVGSDTWITFNWAHNLEISGGGEFYGHGPIAWPYNDCAKTPQCKQLPSTLRLNQMNNTHIHHVNFVDSKNGHITVFGCNNVTINNVRISAPGDSPNTDGIRIGFSKNLRIENTVIGTGDDCVAMLSGCSNININNVTCGPGHGISIGSLGKSENEKDLRGLTVKNCNFINTQNGLRIKTWSPSKAMLVSDILFRNIYMSKVSNPIIIDQNYCPNNQCSGQKGLSKVEIRGVRISQVWGTSATKVALKFDCSKLKPCRIDQLSDINLKYNGRDGNAIATCSNAIGFASGTERPASCLGRPHKTHKSESRAI